MILKKIQVELHVCGIITNCYIIIDEKTNKAMVVDPAGETEKILQIIEYNKANLEYIVLTHCHADHIGAIQSLIYKTDAKVCIHRLDANGLKDTSVSLAKYLGEKNPNIIPNIILEDNVIINVGEIKFKVIHTPGHTIGSICLYTEGLLISGDTLFKGAWGRTDLPTSDFKSIIHSIESRLMVLPDDTIVYPGHGKTTIIKDEKKIYLDLKGD